MMWLYSIVYKPPRVHVFVSAHLRQAAVKFHPLNDINKIISNFYIVTSFIQKPQRLEETVLKYKNNHANVQ